MTELFDLGGRVAIVTGAAIPVGGGFSSQGQSIPRSPPVATPVAMRSDGA